MDVLYTLTLLETKGIGPKTVEYVSAAEPESITELHELLVRAKAAMPRIRLPEYDELETSFGRATSLLKTAYETGLHVIGPSDTRYPNSLKTIPRPPAVLFVRGDPSYLTSASIAVVGTRTPSAYSLRVAQRLSTLFVNSGFVIVSGLALGIDTAAHQGCLDAGGQTVAVLAHGLDRVHPKDNERLAAAIVENGGCLVSEYAPGTSPQKGNFIARDRLQSGLAQAVVVVESSTDGGAMHTARFAEEQGRLLAAFKHPPEHQSENTSGNSHLLAKHAIPLADSGDIERFLGSLGGPAPGPTTQQRLDDEQPTRRSVKTVIFDLDQTLIDSSIAKPYRDARQWSRVYSLIPKLAPYDGISELLEELKRRGILIGIVTSSPRPYLSQVVEQCGWQIDASICYHDTRQHKPHPEPILAVLRLLGASAEDVISVGDTAEDTIAGKRAHVRTVQVSWGTFDREVLSTANPEFSVSAVSELRNLLLDPSVL